MKKIIHMLSGIGIVLKKIILGSKTFSW